MRGEGRGEGLRRNFRRGRRRPSSGPIGRSLERPSVDGLWGRLLTASGAKGADVVTIGVGVGAIHAHPTASDTFHKAALKALGKPLHI